MKYDLSKVKTYVGFAIKSRKIKFGVDDILRLKKTDLIMASTSLTQSGQGKLKAYADNKSASYYEIDKDDFITLVPNDSIKAIAILDGNLAEAIKKILANN